MNTSSDRDYHPPGRGGSGDQTPASEYAHALIRMLLYLNLWTDKDLLNRRFTGQLPPEYGSRRNLARKKPYASVEKFKQVCFERCLRDMERSGEVELRRVDMPPKDELRGYSCWQARLTEKGMRRKLIESRLQPAEPASLSENTGLQEDTVLKMLLASQNTITRLRSVLKDACLTVDAALIKCSSGEADIVYEFDQMESRLDNIEATVLTLVDSFTFRVPTTTAGAGSRTPSSPG